MKVVLKRAAEAALNELGLGDIADRVNWGDVVRDDVAADEHLRRRRVRRA